MWAVWAVWAVVWAVKPTLVGAVLGATVGTVRPAFVAVITGHHGFLLRGHCSAAGRCSGKPVPPVIAYQYPPSSALSHR